jgi:hypothetical protein
MSALMLAFVPIAVLAIVLLLAFVGCGLDDTGTGSHYPVEVVAPPSSLSWWPLTDAGPTTAKDDKDGHDGTFNKWTDPGSVPLKSAAAAGKLDFNADKIIPNADYDKVIRVNGGYVDVSFAASLNTDKFSFIAWVRSEWTDTGNYRCVLSSRESTASVKRGYMLYANPDNKWEAWVGDGTNWHQLTSDGPISLGSTDYLCVTYDGTTLRMFVNVEERPAGGLAVTYAKTTANPLRIGAGAPEGTPPLFPFRGLIGMVSYYNDALDHQTIMNIGLAASQ